MTTDNPTPEQPEHAPVPLAQHVLGGHEPFLHACRQPALEQDRLGGLADLAEKVEVLHVPRADLEAVDEFLHLPIVQRGRDVLKAPVEEQLSSPGRSVACKRP